MIVGEPRAVLSPFSPNLVEVARADYIRCLAEAGITHELVRKLTENEADQMPMPAGLEHLHLNPSAIDGLGLFTAKEIGEAEVIGPARIAGKRTPLGRYANHSPYPNTAFRVTATGDLESVALRHIPAGAEITNNYRQGMSLIGVWFIPEEVEKTRLINARRDMRAKVEAIEKIILQAPQVDLNTAHELSGEVYARTIFIPAGTVLTGAAHNKDHVNIMHGDITVSTDNGMKRLSGYVVMATRAGMKRVGLAHADTWWTTVLHTKSTDVETIEDEMTAESAMLQTRTLKLQKTTTPELER